MRKIRDDISKEEKMLQERQEAYLRRIHSPVSALLTEIRDPELRAKALNVKGIERMDCGDFTVAIDLMLEAKNLVAPGHPQYLVAISNMGKLYDVLGRPDIGCRYTKEAEEEFQKYSDESYLIGRVNNLCLTTSLCLKTGQLEDAEIYMKRIGEIHPGNDENSNILMTQIQYYWAQKDMVNYRSSTDYYFNILSDLLTDPIRIQQANEMCMFFLKNRQLEDAARSMAILKSVIDSCHEPEYLVSYYSNKIIFEELLGDTASRTEDILKHYDLSRELEVKRMKERADQVSFREQMDAVARRQQKMYEENQRLQHLSQTDTLTQIPNRRAFVNNAEHILERAVDASTPVAIEMLDLDCFKQLNDTYGHLEGDKALVSVARILNRIAAESQNSIFVSRNGGDEFCIIYDNLTRKDVENIAWRILELVRQERIPNEKADNSHILTVSQGINYVNPDDKTRLWDLLHEADKALYEVKQNGKANVSIH